MSNVSCVDILGVKLCNRICVRDLDTCIIQIMGVTTESGLFYYVANNVVLVRLFSYYCACTLSRCGQQKIDYRGYWALSIYFVSQQLIHKSSVLWLSLSFLYISVDFGLGYWGQPWGRAGLRQSYGRRLKSRSRQRLVWYKENFFLYWTLIRWGVQSEILCIIVYYCQEISKLLPFFYQQ